jgi:D-threo-aldose 1-dehydrogenase
MTAASGGRRVGRTDLHVSPLGLGCATFGGVAPVEVADAVALVDHAFASGIRYFDTAPQYGYGKSEHILGQGLRERSGVCLSTKVGRRLAPLRTPRPAGDFWYRPLPFAPVYDYSAAGILRSHEDSLQRLGRAEVDILFLHDPDVYVRETGQDRAALVRTIAEAYGALAELRDSGAVKAIGLGVNEAEAIALSLDIGRFDVFMLAGRYTLLEQATLHSLLPAIERHGASVIIAGPFNSGILAGRDTWNYRSAPEPVRRRVGEIAPVCAAYGVPLPAAALQFPLAPPAVASIVPGPRSAAELDDILAWSSLDIPPALWRELKAKGLIDDRAPVPG